MWVFRANDITDPRVYKLVLDGAGWVKLVASVSNFSAGTNAQLRNFLNAETYGVDDREVAIEYALLGYTVVKVADTDCMVVK